MNTENDQYQVSVYTNEGVRFASITHIESGNGADFYESGEEMEWQDNNGMISNCSPSIIALARKIAQGALS
jgi:hypothetical protein